MDETILRALLFRPAIRRFLQLTRLASWIRVPAEAQAEQAVELVVSPWAARGILP